MEENEIPGENNPNSHEICTKHYQEDLSQEYRYLTTSKPIMHAPNPLHNSYPCLSHL